MTFPSFDGCALAMKGNVPTLQKFTPNRSVAKRQAVSSSVSSWEELLAFVFRQEKGRE